MKVLLVGLQKRGGGALDASGLSNGLCANRFWHEIIVSDGNELADEFGDNDYRRTVRIPTYGSSVKSFVLHSLLLARPLRLIAEIRKARPSVVHIVHFHPWDVLVFLARPLFKYKIIYGVQEDPYGRKDASNPLIMGPLERMFVARADIVAPYSDYMKGILAQHIPEQKIKTVYAGDYRRFFPSFKHKGFHTNGTLRILFFGPIKEYKGVDVLVESMAMVKKRGLDVALTIAGTQDPAVHIVDPAEVERLGITWINTFLSREEIGALMEDADVMTIPYREATQTTPGLLAITYGLPAIGTRSGGLPEQVEDGVNGLLVLPGDADAFAAAIEKIYNDRSLLKKFSEGARKLYETKFSWDLIAGDAIREIYNKL